METEATMIQSKPAKFHYSEIEAAAVVGISVDELRNLIRQHVTGSMAEPGNGLNNGPGDASGAGAICANLVDDTKATTFQPSDLVLLRILAGQRASASLVTR